MTKRMRNGALAALLLLPACVLPPTQAELDTYNAVAPEYRAYVEADPSLDVADATGRTAKARRLDLLEAWRIRVGAK